VNLHCLTQEKSGKYALDKKNQIRVFSPYFHAFDTLVEHLDTGLPT